MPFDPTIAAIRFGTGLRPGIAALTPQSLLADLTGPDAEQTLPIPLFDVAQPTLITLRDSAIAKRDASETNAFATAQAADQALRDIARQRFSDNFTTELARAVTAPVGFRERLVRFWADHFTLRARSFNAQHLVTPFIEAAIRPHVAGRFGDMLGAVTTHPLMLLYLDQVQSVGPNSIIGLRKGRGLNENLARELIELHSIGVDGPYTQTDVRELAELLSGLTYQITGGFRFDPRRAEPGAETILGVTYGADASLDTVLTSLNDLAKHPATAAHIATKIARHFIADEPDPILVAALRDVWIDTGGDLLAVTKTMLDHEAAWTPKPHKVRPPFDFVTAAMRALAVDADTLTRLSQRDLQRRFQRPLRIMGQPFQRPTGPDGWPETGADWIIPQTMAGRISWAMQVPEKVFVALPDPREFVIAALGQNPDPAVVFAAGAAQTKAEGIGIVLSSAAFQRR